MYFFLIVVAAVFGIAFSPVDDLLPFLNLVDCLVGAVAGEGVGRGGASVHKVLQITVFFVI